MKIGKTSGRNFGPMVDITPAKTGARGSRVAYRPHRRQTVDAESLRYRRDSFADEDRDPPRYYHRRSLSYDDEDMPNFSFSHGHDLMAVHPRERRPCSEEDFEEDRSRYHRDCCVPRSPDNRPESRSHRRHTLHGCHQASDERFYKHQASDERFYKQTPRITGRQPRVLYGDGNVPRRRGSMSTRAVYDGQFAAVPHEQDLYNARRMRQ